MLTRRGTLTAVLASALPLPAIAQTRPKVRFAGGGTVLYSYMPFFVCVGQNLFAKHGIKPEIAMFPGGAKAVQAVLGGSSDVACGYYEHTIQMAAKGAKLTAFVLQAQNSGLVLGVRQQLADQVRTVADLKGRKLGVSAPGSGTHMFAQLLMAKAGLKPGDVPIIGVGSTQTALSAFERGDVDALSLFDPIMADLELKRAIKILADARDTAGTQAIFGGPYASGSLYAEAGWLAKNPDAARAAAHAILEAVGFLKGATPEQAIGALEKGMCFVGTEICGAAFTHNREAFNHAGVVTPDMAETVHRALASFDQGVANARIDLSATYTGQFVGA